jgi:thiol-disulfide isomerase/thioredoxin
MRRYCLALLILFASASCSHSKAVFFVDGHAYKETDLSDEVQVELVGAESQYLKKRQILLEKAAASKATKDAKNAEVGSKRYASLDLPDHLPREESQDANIEVVVRDSEWQHLSPRLLDTGFPVLGRNDAKHTIAVFYDYNCPHCRDIHQTIEGILPEVTDVVNFVFIDMPILAASSYQLTRGGYCAHQHGLFSEYADLVFNGSHADAKSHLQMLEKENKNLKIVSCLNEKNSEEFVIKGQKLAAIYGFQSTPSFLLDGRITQLPRDPASLLEFIRKLN